MTVLIAVRHGESTANADPAALASCPDADIPLTERGREQCVRLGRDLLALEAPGNVLCSPYARCRETARIVAEEHARAGRSLPAATYDVRLRDREPGESFADVGLRVRSVLDEVRAGTVLLVVHDAVVLMLRHALEGIGERELRMAEPVANASITRWDVGKSVPGKGSAESSPPDGRRR